MCTVSVVMSTYKEEISLLEQAVCSILEQTYKDIEFIIICDNPDNLEHKRYLDSVAHSDHRVKVYINDKNLGLSKSLNKGISLASGKYICRMDADDISLLTRIENQLNYINDNNYDFIGGGTEVIDESNQLIFAIKDIPSTLKSIKKCLNYNQVLAHPTWFLKKDVYDELGGYREIPLCEDSDFTMRAILKGYRVSNFNKTVLRYRMTNNSISRNNLYEQYLYYKYISHKYKHKQVANISEAKKYVAKLNNERKSNNYLKANVIFNECLIAVEKSNYISVLSGMLKILLISPAYITKIARLSIVSLYK